MIWVELVSLSMMLAVDAIQESGVCVWNFGSKEWRTGLKNKNVDIHPSYMASVADV
jgi:hypothetical protein